jgi:hypothetical protein
MAARCSWVIPVVMSSLMVPSRPSTPSAPYLAPVSSAASSTMRCRAAGSDSSAASVSPVSSRRSYRSWMPAIGGSVYRRQPTLARSPPDAALSGPAEAVPGERAGRASRR